MSNKQMWLTLSLVFILLLIVIVGAYVNDIAAKMERILLAPAVTSKIDIDADIMLTATANGELQLEYIHLNRIQGELDSRIIDLLLLSIREER